MTRMRDFNDTVERHHQQWLRFVVCTEEYLLINDLRFGQDEQPAGADEVDWRQLCLRLKPLD